MTIKQTCGVLAHVLSWNQMAAVVDLVAERLALPFYGLQHGKNDMRYREGRALAMLLLRHVGCSFPEVGRFMHVDHTSAMGTVKRALAAEAAGKWSPEFATFYAALTPEVFRVVKETTDERRKVCDSCGMVAAEVARLRDELDELKARLRQV